MSRDYTEKMENIRQRFDDKSKFFLTIQTALLVGFVVRYDEIFQFLQKQSKLAILSFAVLFLLFVFSTILFMLSYTWDLFNLSIDFESKKQDRDALAYELELINRHHWFISGCKLFYFSFLGSVFFIFFKVLINIFPAGKSLIFSFLSLLFVQGLIFYTKKIKRT
jgi:hypothetical protein